jgi:hypothetical protein
MPERMLGDDANPEDHMTIRLRSVLVTNTELLTVTNTVDGSMPMPVLLAKVEATGFQAMQALVIG